MKKNVFIFGSISGIIISTFMGISMAMAASASDGSCGTTGSMVIGFSAMAVAFSFVFVGIKNFRDKQNNGALSFGKGFLIGTLISFIASTLYVLTWGIEYHYFLPDFMDKYSAMQLKQLKESGISGPEFDKAVQSIEEAKNDYENNIFYFSMYTYMEIFPLGILISLISAIILKRKVPANN